MGVFQQPANQTSGLPYYYSGGYVIADT